jgi:hypothetical protein
MADDLLLQRIKESLFRLAQTPQRVTESPPEIEKRIRDSVSRLSRSRVAEILRQLRAAHHLTYEQVQTRTGLSQQLLFDVEYKERRLTLDELRLLAECYQVSTGDVLGIDLD